MKLSETKRTTLFMQGSSINDQLGKIFQNDLDISESMIDQEFDQVESFELEIQLYKDQLSLLRQRAC